MVEGESISSPLAEADSLIYCIDSKICLEFMNRWLSSLKRQAATLHIIRANRIRFSIFCNYDNYWNERGIQVHRTKG